MSQHSWQVLSLTPFSHLYRPSLLLSASQSGGPLIQKADGSLDGTFTVMGVVSWGNGCAQDPYPGVYARVSEAYNWIGNEVCLKSAHRPDWCGDFSAAPSMSFKPSMLPRITSMPSVTPSMMPSCPVRNPTVDRIINGQEAPLGCYPFTVSLQVRCVCLN